MTDIPDSFEIDGVQLYRGAAPTDFFYIPAAPRPELDARGQPTLLLLTSGRGGRLQLGAQWGIDAATLATLQRTLPRRFPDLQGQQPQLQPAPVNVKEAALEVGDGHGSFETLATSTSSGFGNYAAVFAVSLSAAQQERVGAALHGREQFVQVVYRGTLAMPVAGEVTITGDVQDDLEELGSNPTLNACRQRVGEALDEGRLTLERTGATSATAEWAKAEQYAREKAALALQRLAMSTSQGWWGSRDKEATIDVSAGLSDEVLLPIERSTDVSTWFANGRGSDHITVVAADPPLPQPDGTSKGGEVRLAFEPADAPLAFVELVRAGATATLRGPGFAAITLPAGSGPLLVKTHYTQGSAPYETTLDAPGPAGWALSPADLGLAQVIVDGAAPHEAGAREARVRVRYVPTGNGIADDRTIYLRRDEWAARWFLITRAADLGGTLEVEWKETGANGNVTMHRSTTLNTPEITL